MARGFRIGYGTTDAQGGVYSVTGQDVQFLRTRRLVADVGLYNLNGQQAELRPSGLSAFTTAISASRTVGPAPLAVAFDALGTTHGDGSVNVFRDIGYSFDFVDNPGNWTHDGRSKRYERGAPLAAHVFDTPGTYLVKVRGRDSTGATHQSSVLITVQDPNTVYSGTNTVCISRTSDTTGAPAGAQLITNATGWPTWQSNKRYMLRAGQDFSSFGTISWTGIRDSQLRSFGAGAKPITPYISMEMGSPPSGSPPNWAARNVIMDVQVRESGVYSIQTGKSTTDILIYRVTADGLIAFGHNFNFYFDNGASQSPPWTTEQRNAIFRDVNKFVVESSVGQLSTINASGRGIYLLGNTSISPEEHSVRLWQGYKVLAAHNLLANAGNSEHQFKFHSAGTDTPYDDFLVNQRNPASSFVVLRNNVIGATSESNPWAVTFGPQSGGAQYIEGVEDVIVEDNNFAFNFSVEISFGGRRMTARGNTGISLAYQTSYNQAGKTELLNNWNSQYQTGGSSITTVDPV